MTSDGVNGYTYDFQGRPVTVNSTSFIYDAFGRIAEENVPGTVTHVLYQPDGSRFATLQNGGIQNYFAPMVNGMVEVFNSSGEQYIRHTDWLGTSRLATHYDGTMEYDLMYAPYGETEQTGTANRFFTGNTQDAVNGQTGIYDFQLREYTSGGGRWMVPDPAGLAAVDITNPQTWNRYAYVGNNPLSNVDPLGLCVDNGGSPTSTGVDADGNQTFTYSANNAACQDADRSQPPPKVDPVSWNNIGAGSGQAGKLPPNFFKNGNWLCQNAVNGALQCTPGVAKTGDVTTPGIEGLFHAPGMAQMWNSAYSWGEAAFFGTGAAVAAPVLAGTAASAGTIDIAVGTADGGVHFAWAVDGTWYHAIGDLDGMLVTTHFAQSFAEGAYVFSIPALNPANAIPVIGAAATNCFTSACGAVINSWHP